MLESQELHNQRKNSVLNQGLHDHKEVVRFDAAWRSLSINSRIPKYYHFSFSTFTPFCLVACNLPSTFTLPSVGISHSFPMLFSYIHPYHRTKINWNDHWWQKDKMTRWPKDKWKKKGNKEVGITSWILQKDSIIVLGPKSAVAHVLIMTVRAVFLLFCIDRLHLLFFLNFVRPDRVVISSPEGRSNRL